MATTAKRPGLLTRPRFADEWRRLRKLVSRRGARRLAQDVMDGFAENDLLTYASAISFRVLFALVPLLLAGVAVLGFFRLEDVYRDQVAPEIQSRVSTGAYAVIDATVREVAGSGSGFWLTLGVALAVYEVSGAMRAIMGVLSRVYGAQDHRSFKRRMSISVLLALVTTVALGLAAVALQLGPTIVDKIGLQGSVLLGLARWGGAVLLMLFVVGILIRYAPARHQRRSWIGVTAVTVTSAWILTSLIFNWYATTIATYRSIYGNLSIAIVLMTYLYVSTVTFLLGVQLDAILRRRYARERE